MDHHTNETRLLIVEHEDAETAMSWRNDRTEGVLPISSSPRPDQEEALVNALTGGVPNRLRYQAICIVGSSQSAMRKWVLEFLARQFPDLVRAGRLLVCEPPYRSTETSPVRSGDEAASSK